MNWSKSFNELPGWSKGIIAVVGVGIVAFAGFKIYGAIKQSVQNKGERKETSQWKNDVDMLADKGIKPSFPDSQYSAWANELEKAYSGCDPFLQSGLSTGKIFKQLKNDADFAKLNTAWGIRSYKGCLLEKDFNGTLIQALNSELLGATRDALNMQLKANGITYRV